MSELIITEQQAALAERFKKIVKELQDVVSDNKKLEGDGLSFAIRNGDRFNPTVLIMTQGSHLEATVSFSKTHKF